MFCGDLRCLTVLIALGLVHVDSTGLASPHHKKQTDPVNVPKRKQNTQQQDREEWSAAGSVDACAPERITATDNAGCGRFFPRFHPKNAKPLGHNNDAKLVASCGLFWVDAGWLHAHL